MSPLIRVTPSGLFCETGGFHINPWRPTPSMRAVITHAHSDHSRLGAGEYLTAASGVGLLRARLDENARVTGHPFGEPLTLGDTRVSLHPAGHVLDSAMIRVVHKGEVWVVSGDYKTHADPTCEKMEPIRCDTVLIAAQPGHGRRMFQAWYQMEALLLSGRLELDEIITHEIPMEDFAKGFKLMQTGEGIKVVMRVG